MERSTEIGQLFAALATAQGEFPPIKKTKTAKIPLRSGGSYEYKYADLADMNEQIMPVCSKNGLLVTSSIVEQEFHPLVDANGETHLVMLVTVETLLGHKSWQWMSNKTTVIVRQIDTQGIGSGTTYARRYGEAAILNLAPDTDDDGQAAGTVSDHDAKSSKQEQPDNPGDFVMPIGAKQGWKGKKLSELDEDVLAFVLSEDFKSKDVKEAVERYVRWREEQPAPVEEAPQPAPPALASWADLAWLMTIALFAEQQLGETVVNQKKVMTLLNDQQKKHNGEVPFGWFKAAESEIAKHLDADQLADARAEYEREFALLSARPEAQDAQGEYAKQGE